MDERLGVYLVYGIWALVCVTAWAVAFTDDLGEFRNVKHDRRMRSATSELMADFALLLSAIAAAISLVVLILDQDIPGLRGFTIAVFLGGFAGAGIVKATARKRT